MVISPFPCFFFLLHHCIPALRPFSIVCVHLTTSSFLLTSYWMNFCPAARFPHATTIFLSTFYFLSFTFDIYLLYILFWPLIKSGKTFFSRTPSAPELYETDADIGHQQFGLKLTPRVNMRMVGFPESSFSTCPDYPILNFLDFRHRLFPVFHFCLFLECRFFHLQCLNVTPLLLPLRNRFASNSLIFLISSQRTFRLGYGDHNKYFKIIFVILIFFFYFLFYFLILLFFLIDELLIPDLFHLPF